jgi:hypothetical protein
MHTFEIPPSLAATLGSLNCWAVAIADVEKLAVGLLGASPNVRVRRGTQRAIIAERKFGAAADRLPQEFARLADQTTKMRGDGREAADLCAAAFYHLRFAHIHPLLDGNGRVGRLLLAVQCSRATGYPAAEILSSLHELAEDYQLVFGGPNDATQYELMVNLLARILAVAVPDTLALPFALTPVFPERDTRPGANMRHALPVPKRRSAFF